MPHASDVTFTRRNVKKHGESTRHRDAVRRDQDRAEQRAYQSARQDRDIGPATLSSVTEPVRRAEASKSPEEPDVLSSLFMLDVMVDEEGEAVTFSAGEVEDERERTRLLREIKNLDFLEHDHSARLYDFESFTKESDATVTNVAAEIEALGEEATFALEETLTFIIGFSEDSSDDESASETEGQKMHSSHPWYPHGSKVMYVHRRKLTDHEMFLLDMLDNMPRLRLSSDHMKFILWILKEVGVHGVPSFNSFRKRQDQIKKLGGTHL
ncbi:hypothetical protein A0H81_11586 [Grifola frondosa]|uniref:Uncharacterized protein n=1 Tax=Grifola frondosa TaxID=5627 RepID=A0A1C7LUR8_GRIFR|nr:hypothetical protein A0H81_11586 [Grifola frondosa]